MIRVLWAAFLVVVSVALFAAGAVRPGPVAATALAMGVLYGLSLTLLPESPRMSKPFLLFLAGLAGILLLQALPLPFLYPHATQLRRMHGVGALWPGTADAFLSAKFVAQTTSYILAGLLVLRLRQAGLSTSSAIRGLLLIAGLEAAWGLVRTLSGIQWIPFWDGEVMTAATGTLVNRNNFSGFCSMGLALAAGLAASRFTWPPRTSEESGHPSAGRRLEASAGWALLATLFAVAIVLSKSRGGVLAALAGLAALPILHRGRTSATAVAAVVAGGVVAVVAANPAGLLARFEGMDPFELSSEQRWRIWEMTAAAAWHQPLLGFGVGTHPNAFHPFQSPDFGVHQVQHAHNEYVNVLFEAGGVGLLFALVALWAWLRRAWTGLRPLHGPDRLPAAGVVAAVIAILVHSLVDFDLRITGVGLFWAALAGLGATLSRDGVPSSGAAWTVPAVGVATGVALLLLPLRSLGLTPYDADLAWKAALAEKDLGKLELAASIFPAHPTLQRKAGLMFWDAGDAPRAARCLQRLFTQTPGEVERVLEEIYEPSRPVAEYEALLPGTSAAGAHLAAFLAKGGDWQASMGVWERRVAPDAGSPAPHDVVASAFQATGQWGLEARVRERRLEARTDAYALAACAESWHRLGAMDKALDRVQGAIRISREPRWIALKAEILQAKGDSLGALEAWSEAIGAAPSQLDYRRSRGSLALQQRLFQTALDDYREVERSIPGDRGAILGQAKALLALERRDAARLLLDTWLARHAEDAEAESLRNQVR